MCMFRARGSEVDAVLVQFILSSDVQRVGIRNTSTLVPRTLPAAEGDLSEPAEPQKISDLLITKWRQSMVREKKVSCHLQEA